MTREEADRAARWFENRASGTTMPGAREMFRLAAKALRGYEERENNRPLRTDRGCYCRECKFSDECNMKVEFLKRSDPNLNLSMYEYHQLEYCSYGKRREPNNA